MTSLLEVITLLDQTGRFEETGDTGKNIQETDYVLHCIALVSFDKTESFVKKKHDISRLQTNTDSVLTKSLFLKSRLFVQTENKQNISVLCFV